MTMYNNSSSSGECGANLLGHYDLKLHVIALFVVMGCSLLGTFLPIVGKKSLVAKYDLLFACGKMFGTGVILATAFVHMLIPATQNLTNPCLPSLWTSQYTSFSGAICLATVLGTQLLQLMVSQQMEKNFEKEREKLPLNQGKCATESHGHEHGFGLILQNSHKVSVYILGLGIASHSVIIGLTLGVARDPEFQPLLAALTFHQFFEGLALSTIILDAKFAPTLAHYLLPLVYILTTPSGIAIGIAISQAFNENSTENLLAQGILDSISAGVLIYDALVNILAPHFEKREFRKLPAFKQGAQIACLWIGAGLMAVIGRWA